MRGRWVLAAVGVLAIILFAVDVELEWGGRFVTDLVDDLGELAAALVATGFAVRRAVVSRQRLRWSWALIGAGTGCWAAGQAVWCYYELIERTEVPFPSVADLGFLALPVLALIGLLIRPATGLDRRGRIRMLLDGILVAASLFVITWVTAFGHVLEAGADSSFALTVALAYPIGDLLLLTVTLVVVTHTAQAERLGLGLLACGFGLLSVADSGFAYLTASDSFGNGNWIDAGWVAGFVLVAVAAARDGGTGEDGPARPASVVNTQLLLPYVPGVLGLAITVYQVRGDHRDDVSLMSAALIMFALMARQLLVLRDNRELAASATRQAFHDGLTGLANRSLFTDRLGHALELHRRDLRAVSVLFLDLDDFKLVNDSLGHASGDELLIRVADRLRGALRPGDTLARLGGDEFAVLIEDGGEPSALAERLREVLQAPVTLSGHDTLVHASIGIATVEPTDATPTSGQLMANADVAMYHAKRAGKNDIALHRVGMDLDRYRDFELGAALAAAIQDGSLGIAYQPVVSLASGEVEGYEALARWTYDGAVVAPATFIPLAERQGLMSELTDLMLERACAQLTTWSAAAPGLTMAVNVPTPLLRDQGFPVRVERLLARHDLGPRRLVLEITESSLVENSEETTAVCRRLSTAGALLALDDFGTGYSSLAHLQTIPLGTLKIDRMFVDAVDTEPAARQLLSAIVDLAHNLDLCVVAEGVERPEQLLRLRALGCESAQGFWFARPQPAGQIEPGRLAATPRTQATSNPVSL